MLYFHRMKARKKYLFILLTLCLVPSTLDAENFLDESLNLGFWTWQKVISPADGARCQMYPTCSEYAYQAFKKHGLIVGSWMTADRLMRDHGQALERYTPIEKYGITRWQDKVSDNDFWFKKSNELEVEPQVLPPKGPLPSTSPTNVRDSFLEEKSFADFLYNQADYDRAITEYKRLLYFYPQHPKKDNIEFSIGYAYLHQKKWDLALRYFEKISIKNSPLASDAIFATAYVHLLSGKRDPAINTWSQLSPKNEFSVYQQAWAHFLQGRITNTRALLSTLKTPHLKARAHIFSSDLSRWENRPSRSPWLAGCMSAVLPGSGQWYVGHFWDGISALIINGLFIYGAYYAFSHHHYVTGGVVSLVGSGFYGGNIFSAVSSAYKFNQRIDESIHTDFERKYGLKIDWAGSRLIIKF